MKVKNKAKSDDLLLINPFYYIKLLKDKVVIIILFTLFTSSIGVYIAITFVTPTYKAGSKIIRYDKKISMPKDVPYKFQNFNYETALQTIRTRKNLEEVIEKLKLDITIEKLYSKFEVKKSRKSDIIEILYVNEDINKAVYGANLLSEIFLRNFYAIQNAATKEIFDYYKEQKVDVVKDVGILKQKKDDFLKKHNLLSISVQKDYKYEQLNEIDLSLIEANVQKKEALIKEKEIKEKLTQIPNEVKLRYSVRSADIKNVQDKIKELRNLREKYTVYNPKVKRLANEIRAMKAQIRENKNKKAIPDETTYGNNPIYISLNIEQAKANIDITASENRIKELKKQKLELKKQIANLNRLEKDFNVIQNKLSQKNSLLTMIQSRLDEVKIALESAQSDFKFLERAQAPEYPQSSYKKAIAIGFFFLGFLSSVAFFILRAFFDLRIKEPFDVDKRFDIELIGTFIKSSNESISKRSEIEFENNFLELNKDNKKSNITLFGSDYAKTGKTYVINLLTEVLSSQKTDTLFIESITKITPEIEDCLINKAIFENEEINLNKVNKINEHIHKLYFYFDSKNEYVLPDFKALEKLFDTLKKSKYEHILFEMPQSKNNPYFFIDIAQFCDEICLVLKANYSHRKELSFLMEQLNKHNINKVKGVLNAIDKKYI